MPANGFAAGLIRRVRSVSPPNANVHVPLDRGTVPPGAVGPAVGVVVGVDGFTGPATPMVGPGGETGPAGWATVVVETGWSAFMVGPAGFAGASAAPPLCAEPVARSVQTMALSRTFAKRPLGRAGLVAEDTGPSMPRT